MTRGGGICRKGKNMTGKFTAEATTIINTPVSRVWEALTNPSLIKQYLYGTEVTSDWKAGSPITYKGEWEGKSYEDKGEILQIEPNTLLVSTFWSSLAGLPDIPENYKTLRYELSPENGGTRITITQDNNATQEEADHSKQNWNTVLDKLKELLEK
jgi:uncharacterized protein YndB with AHSA1/START domain